MRLYGSPASSNGRSIASPYGGSSIASPSPLSESAETSPRRRL